MWLPDEGILPQSPATPLHGAGLHPTGRRSSSRAYAVACDAFLSDSQTKLTIPIYSESKAAGELDAHRADEPFIDADYMERQAGLPAARL